MKSWLRHLENRVERGDLVPESFVLNVDHPRPTTEGTYRLRPEERITGWAVSSSPVREVRALLDGRRLVSDAPRVHRTELVSRRKVPRDFPLDCGFFLPLRDLPSGRHLLEIEAVDGKGHVARWSRSVRVVPAPDWRNSEGTTAESLRHLFAANLDRFLRSTERIAFPVSADPRVSILVVVHGQPALTLACLDALKRHTSGGYELLLWDNGSDAETRRLLSRIDGARILRSAQNLGFAKGCNRLAEKARATRLVFLNSDAFVSRGWLPPLLKAADTLPDFGSVGSLLALPDGSLQESGSMLFSDGSCRGYGRGREPFEAEFGHLREVDFASAACLLVETKTFFQVGGLSEAYGKAYYEDVDLAMRMRREGKKNFVQPASRVVHFEHGSSSSAEAARRISLNRGRFQRTWEKDLARQPAANAPEPFARTPSRKKRILAIDDFVPAQELGNGFPRALSMWKALQRSGFDVSLIPAWTLPGSKRRARRLQEIGIEVLDGHFLRIPDLLRERKGFFSAAVVSRPHNFSLALPWLETFQPDAVRIYDAEALFTRREARMALARGLPLEPSASRRFEAEEGALAAKADAFIAVSELERRRIANLSETPLDRSLVWEHAIDVAPGKTPFGRRTDVLFLGNFYDPEGPNALAAKELVEKVWPKLRRKAGLRLTLAGADPEGWLGALKRPGIRIVSSPASIRPLFERARVFVCPSRAVSGVPLKAIEALAHGVPCVTSPEAAEGLGDCGVAVRVGKGPGDCARKTLALYSDPQAWREAREEALMVSVTRFAVEAQSKRLKTFLESLIDAAALRSTTSRRKAARR